MGKTMKHLTHFITALLALGLEGSAITALLGAPFFLFLLLRGRSAF